MVFKISKPKMYNDKMDLLTYIKIVIKSMIDQLEEMEMALVDKCGRLFDIHCNFEIDETFYISREKIEELFNSGYKNFDDV